MTGRLIAWIVVLALAWGGYTAVKAWKNPWTPGSSVLPVLAVMPAIPDGCAKSEKCK